MTIDDLLAAWRVNCAINYELLELCSDEDLELKPGKGKTIRSNFVHIAGVRRSHLEERMKKESAGIPKPDRKSASRAELVEVLTATDALMEEAFRKQDGTGKPARWTAATFFGYSVAHEAHHRSQVEIALRLNGREPSDDVLYRLWEWPRK